MDSLIKLTVRTPNQRFEDLEIDCDLCWTVSKLKEYLENVYPSKPSSSSQRLIYLGKLLQDHVSLREVFSSAEEGNSNGVRTLHIVCADLAEGRSTSGEKHVTACAAAIPASPSTSVLSQEGLRHRSTAQGAAVVSEPVASNRPASASSQPNAPSAPIGPGSASAYAGMAPNALHWQQQYQYHMQEYLRCMQQWHQHPGLATLPGGSAVWQSNPWPQVSRYPGVYIPSPSPLAAPSPVPAGGQPCPASSPANQGMQPQALSEAAAARRPVAAAARAPQNQNVRMNAGPGGAMMEEEDDEEGAPRQRDWLDWVYMLLRALMLLSIVYFYSSTSRFVLVSLLGFIIYMYQAGYLTPRRNVPAAQAGPAHLPQLVEGEGLEQMRPERDRDGAEGRPAEGGSMDAARAVVARPPRINIFRVMCKFFVSFFTSLVPQAPPPMQGN